MATQQRIDIVGMRKGIAAFEIVGISPLITNRWSEEHKAQIRDKHQKKPKTGREIRKPEKEYEASKYYFGDGKRSGIKAVAFKQAMERAAKLLGYNMIDVRPLFFVIPDEGELIEVYGKSHMREDPVNPNRGGSDLRYRAEYPEWSAKLTIQYNETLITPESLAKLIEVAGFSCGVGDFRPEKSSSGMFGRFELSN